MLCYFAICSVVENNKQYANDYKYNDVKQNNINLLLK